MNELEEIVRRMLEAGEPEENIAAVIKRYTEGKQNPTALGAVVEDTVAPTVGNTELNLGDGFSGSVPVVKDENNIAGFEPVSDPNNPEVLENYEQKEKSAQYAGRIAREKTKYDEIYGIKDEEGNFVTDDFGNIKRRELSSLEKINNSFQGIVDRIKTFDDKLDINTGVLFEQLLPDELLEDYDKNGEKSLLGRIPSIVTMNPFAFNLIGSKTDIENAQKEIQTVNEIAQQRGGTGQIAEGFKEGDAGEIASGVVNGLTSFVPSLVLGTATLGTSTAIEFFGDAYVDYNSEVAKRKGITFKELRDKNQDSFAVPATVAGINTILEQLGFGAVGKAITNKAGAAGLKKLANFVLAGTAEGLTEYFQTAVEAAQNDYAQNENALSATTAFVDSLLSQEGLESFLQGFVGGSGVSGTAGNTDNIKSFIKTASNLRAPSDVKGIEQDIDELANLQAKLKRARTETSKQGIQQKINEVNSRLSSRIIKSNSIVPKLTQTQIDEVNNMGDLAELQVARVKKLNEELEEGKIKRSDYLLALEGYKATYIDAKNRIKGIADSVKTEPETKVAEEVDTTETTTEETAINKIITKAKVASKKVQDIYNEKGIEGALDIINLFKPITNRIVQKRKDAPNFDQELLTSEIEIGERGILDLIRSYNPNSGVPLAAYINKFLPARAIEASQRILGEKFTEDVTEAKGVAATEVTDDIVTEPQTQETKQARQNIAEDLNLDEETLNEVKNSVRKTFGTKLPAVTDKKFRRALIKNFRNDLAKTFKNILGRGAAYKEYLTDNFENIFKAIPQETLNKKFSGLFTEAVTDEEGKQLREKTQVGKKVFKRPNITVEQFVDYFTGPDVYANLANSRKTSLAELLADEIGLDEVIEALKEPEVKEKFKAVQELQGQKVPSDFEKQIATAIGRLDKFIESMDKFLDPNSLRVSLFGLDVGAAFVAKKAAQTIKLGLQGGLTLAEAITNAMKTISDYIATKQNRKEVEKAFKEAFKTNNDITKTGLDKVKSVIKKVLAKELKETGVNQSVQTLKDRVKKAKTLNEKIQVIVDNIKFESKSIRTLATLGTTNKDYFDNVIKPIIEGNKNLKDKFRVTKDGRGRYNIQLKDSTGKYNKISGLTDVTAIKKNFGKYIDKMKSESKQSQDYIFNLIEYYKNNNQIEEGIAHLKTLMEDQRSVGRKMSEPGLYVTGLPAGKTTMEHSIPIIEQYENLIKALKGEITIEEARKFISDGKINLVTKEIDAKLNELGLKQEGGKERMQNPEIKSMITKLGDKVENKESIYPDTKQETAEELSQEFNKILEDKTGISSDKVYSDTKASVVGRNKGRFKFFIPPSAEDFIGLLYSTLSKGKLGDKQLKWYEDNLIKPFAKAMSEISRERTALTAHYKSIVKNLKIVPKDLRKEIPGEGFTREQAVRVYMWNKDGLEVPGLNNEDLQMLIDTVENDAQLKDFADQLLSIQPEGLASPTEAWLAGSIDSDILASLNTTKRAQYLEQWQENVDAIFSKDNLNKLEAIYGKPYRKALENILKRMQTGRNRSFGGDSLTTRFVDWITNSVGAIMFFNTRSAVLQTISAVNFINWSDNNFYNAAKAFANQKQFWSDFTTLFNSDFLQDRRGGLKINVNETDIAEMAATSKNKVKGVISGLLKLGFLPTQIADSFAIAAGGASFYRNRIKALVKEGMSKEDAEKQTMLDFQEKAEEAQQSSRPDRISQQQAGPLGRVILAFANTPAQYARLTKKAILDLKNGRGDAKTNISKIIYYGVVQNIIFTALQQALFKALFDDEEEEEDTDKYLRGANSMLDSFLRGLGFAGAAVSVGKNVVLEILKQSEKRNPEYENAALKLLDISPPISSKISKIRGAGRIFSWNKKEIREKGLSWDNPANEAIGKIISATTNIPVDRAIQKADNIQNALAEDTEIWQRLALIGGWKDWELGMQETKKKKKKKSSRTRTRTRKRKRTRN